MNKAFSDVRLSNGTVRVHGPFDDEGMEVKHLRFMIAQGGVMVEDEAHASGGDWSGHTAAGGLQPGPALAFALAVMLKPAAPPRFETFTWFEDVTLTT
jgi:hypothetical protein